MPLKPSQTRNILMKAKQAKEKNEPHLFKIKNYKCMAKTWKRDFKVGNRSASKIYETLDEDGYTILVITEWGDIGEESKIYTAQQKIYKAQEQKFKPDAIAMAPKLEDVFFLDCKGKTSQAWLGWVNERDYQKYWKAISKLDMKMRIYFYIEESNEIWYHGLRDPYKEPHFQTIPQPDAEVYVIPHGELMLYKKLSA
ncbi:MAG: hypothetical protein OEZ35_04580 [Candidatus Bathyarchaeota archaeon]|nr:hypothetical protein [Candidatus Bathyarchaeota archaeon]